MQVFAQHLQATPTPPSQLAQHASAAGPRAARSELPGEEARGSAAECRGARATPRTCRWSNPGPTFTPSTGGPRRHRRPAMPTVSLRPIAPHTPRGRASRAWRSTCARLQSPRTPQTSGRQRRGQIANGRWQTQHQRDTRLQVSSVAEVICENRPRTRPSGHTHDGQTLGASRTHAHAGRRRADLHAPEHRVPDCGERPQPDVEPCLRLGGLAGRARVRAGARARRPVRARRRSRHGLHLACPHWTSCRRRPRSSSRSCSPQWSSGTADRWAR